ncbi:MAG TPA: HEAT repeat domain-containing protein [Acidobacteriaceae bacterium]|nr:HEAT repeat domain-containing protein [Acidobacteriaceae bacterium]
MRCQDAQESIVFAQYGELSDELLLPLEQHLNTCENCRREWNAYLALSETLALDPVVDPSPNLLAASRLRLDEALDAMPPRSVTQRFSANAFRWLGFLTGSPALATLLLGVGFLGGNALTRYQVRHLPLRGGPVVISHPTQGAIASVSGVRQTPNSDRVEVDYNRLVPESVQGSMSDPEIRNLLLLGTKLAANSQARETAVSAVAYECRAGHACGSSDGPETGSSELRLVLVNSLRFDGSPKVRLQALNGLEPYVAEDVHVRDAVLEALMHDKSEAVRTQAISMLSPVGADSSVRQALRTVSAEDANPAVRNASYQVLQSASDIE